MGPDFRVLVAKARKSAQAYWKIYGEYPSTRVMVGEIATVMQDATQSGCVILDEQVLTFMSDLTSLRCCAEVFDHSEFHFLSQVMTTRKDTLCTKLILPVPSGRGKLVRSERTRSTQRLSLKNGLSFSLFLMPLLPLRVLTHREYRYNDDLSLEDAIHTALLTLKEGFEGVMDEKTIELGIISTQPTDETFNTVGHGTGLKGSPGFRKLTEQEVAE